ncbi:hypothetical protein RHMOL_Rhmol04G0060000 [Rhododendron molle]|uniref:Uncharacterized protein n=1 Tax=Rhododendron molle TaxID=49168 RepID=A0ACC0NXR5_RHOML|nr:hypothetical protein RHMOL_Rhmol04G0060000 [Rhododendron molle]
MASCNLKEFPKFLRFQDELEVLNLANNGIHGQIPTWLWNTIKETMRNIDLHGNFLTGFEQHPNAIPWISPQFIDFSFNRRQGPLPLPLPSILLYSVADNLQTGEIPLSLRQNSALFALALSDNYLSWAISQCLAGTCSDSLMLLNLSNNNFEDDRSALLQFKESFFINEFASVDLSAYSKIESWKLDGNTSDCCSWDGVECDHDSGRVIGLDLSSSFLYGSVNSNSSLFSLVHLQRLNLAGNDFNYSQVPTGIGNLSRLRSLNLSNSFFSGQIPSEISSLSQLTFLDLSIHVYPYSTKSHLKLEKPSLRDLVQNLTSLKVLDLSGVNLSSTVSSALSNMTSLTSLSLINCLLHGEFPMAIFHLPNLQMLRLPLNENLFGYLPEFSRGSQLEELTVGWTSFSGMLPISIGNLEPLKLLELQYTNLYGMLPPSVGNLAQLTYLEVSRNNFWGKIPSSIDNLSKLTLLGLSGGTFDAGTLPFILGKLSKLTALYITGTKVSDVLPQCLANLTHLSALVLSNNELLGEIPSWLLNLTGFTNLDLSGNHLYGMFPSSISQLKHLEVLDLVSNSLSGVEQHPDAIPWISLLFLDFSFNRLQGPLPLPPPTIIVYIVAGNLLTGEVPRSFCQNSALFALDVSNNYLSGTIPQCLSSSTSDSLALLNMSTNNFHGTAPQTFMRGIKMIDLSQNQLHGGLPLSLANCTMLEILVVGDNQIEDTFPFWLGTLPQLEVLVLRSNRFHGAIETPKTNLKFPKLRIIDLSHNGFFAVDLSNNKFMGEISESLGSFGGLQALNISKNNLTGAIPMSMANLTDLESLDISRNLLSGEIPQQLTQLTFLSVLNVSHNHLTGHIPRETSPLPPLPHSSQGDDSEFSRDIYWIVIIIGYGSGLTAGLVIGQTLTPRYHEWFVAIFERGKKPQKRPKRKGRRN